MILPPDPRDGPAFIITGGFIAVILIIAAYCVVYGV